jgi:hypothetical protein
MPVLTFARYILEMSLLEYSFNVETSESLLAAAALVLAFKIKGIEGWVETLKVINYKCTTGFLIDHNCPQNIQLL